LKSETGLSRAIRRALERLGHWVIRTQSRGRTGPRSVATGEPGLPDLMVLLRGGHVAFLEVKRPTGRLSPEQVAWHERARAMGIRVAVVRSVPEAVDAVRAFARGEAA